MCQRFRQRRLIRGRSSRRGSGCGVGLLVNPKWRKQVHLVLGGLLWLRERAPRREGDSTGFETIRLRVEHPQLTYEHGEYHFCQIYFYISKSQLSFRLLFRMTQAKQKQLLPLKRYLELNAFGNDDAASTLCFCLTIVARCVLRPGTGNKHVGRRSLPNSVTHSVAPLGTHFFLRPRARY